MEGFVKKTISVFLLFCFTVVCSQSSSLSDLPIFEKNEKFNCKSTPYYTQSESLFKRQSFIMWSIKKIIARITPLAKTDFKEKEMTSRYKGNKVVKLNSINAIMLIPKQIKNDKVFLYLHGGGYVGDLLFIQKKFMADVAKRSGSPVVMLRYSLAPEHPFPVALNESFDAYLQLLKKYPKIVLIGDSAGGGLAFALTYRLQDEQKKQPNQIVAISPWVDLGHENPKIQETAKVDPFLSDKLLNKAARTYVGGKDKLKKHPYVSPLYRGESKIKSTFPPVLGIDASHDILHHDALLLYDKLRKGGASVTNTLAPGAFHVFPIGPNFIPEARSAKKQIASFVNCY